MKDIIITSEMVEEWKREIEELEKRINRDRRKLQLLNNRVQALPLYHDKSLELQIEEEDKDIETPFEDLSPADAIIATLSKAEGGTMSAGELREAVINTGYPQERWGKNFAYFYTVLKRLVDSGTLGKEADRYSYP